MILDTNALSAAADQEAGLIKILAGVDKLALPVIVIGEYRYGIAQSRHRARRERWLGNLIADCDVLDVTNETTFHYAAICAELRAVGKPLPTNDLWIASLCREHGLPVLSRDRHFDAVSGIQRIDW